MDGFHRSLKVATRVRIPLGVPEERAGQRPRQKSRGLGRSPACHPPCHPLASPRIGLAAHLGGAMASVRQLPSGRWQLRVHTGRDPLTGSKTWVSTTVDATGKRDAQHQASAWEVELREQEAPHPRGTFGDLAEQPSRPCARRRPPSPPRRGMWSAEASPGPGRAGAASVVEAARVARRVVAGQPAGRS